MDGFDAAGAADGSGHVNGGAQQPGSWRGSGRGRGRGMRGNRFTTTTAPFRGGARGAARGKPFNMTWTRSQTQEAPATQSTFGAVVPEDSGVEDENEVVIELSATEDEAAQHTDGLSHDGELAGDSMTEDYGQEDEQDEQTAEEDQDDDNDEDDQLTEDGNEEDDDVAEIDAASRKKRFESSLPNNRFLELKPMREARRLKAIQQGIIPDPSKPMRLDQATNFKGTCEEMCPEWERHEREYQNNVDPLERYPGTNRIDPSKAVKAFHRPAAGNDQPLPEDVRPPHVLQRTLDYLFHTVLPAHPLAVTHPFLRDRTRSVRQDLTMQNERGAVAIECNERIARYHVLALGMLRDQTTFSESQELEQLRKVLKSLNEFYDDNRLSDDPIETPNEPEFRAYTLLTHLRDPDIIWSCEMLPLDVFEAPAFARARLLHSAAQRVDSRRGERIGLNSFSTFFKLVASSATPFLFACVLSTHFDDIRRIGCDTLRKAFTPQHGLFPLDSFTRMFGCDNAESAQQLCEDLGLNIVENDSGELAVELHRQVAITGKGLSSAISKRFVAGKQGPLSWQQVIDQGATSSTRASAFIPNVVSSARAQGTPKARPPASTPASTAATTTTSLFAPQAAPAQKANSLNPFATSFKPSSTPSSSAAAPQPSAPFSFAPARKDPVSAPVVPAQPFAATTKPASSVAVEKSVARPAAPTEPKAPVQDARNLDAERRAAAEAQKAQRVQSVVASLASELLVHVARGVSRQVASDVLKDVHQREQERRQQAQATSIAGFVERLSKQALQDGVKRGLAAAVVREKRHARLLRNTFKTWSSKAREQSEEKRRRAIENARLEQLLQQIGSARSLAHLSSKDNFLIQTSDFDSSQRLKETISQRDEIWLRGVASQAVRDSLPRTTETLAAPLKAFVLADSTTAFGAWLRWKFGLTPEQSETRLHDQITLDVIGSDRVPPGSNSTNTVLVICDLTSRLASLGQLEAFCRQTAQDMASLSLRFQPVLLGLYSASASSSMSPKAIKDTFVHNVGRESDVMPVDVTTFDSVWRIACKARLTSLRPSTDFKGIDRILENRVAAWTRSILLLRDTGAGGKDVAIVRTLIDSVARLCRDLQDLIKPVSALPDPVFVAPAADASAMDCIEQNISRPEYRADAAFASVWTAILIRPPLSFDAILPHLVMALGDYLLRAFGSSSRQSSFSFVDTVPIDRRRPIPDNVLAISTPRPQAQAQKRKRAAADDESPGNTHATKRAARSDEDPLSSLTDALRDVKQMLLQSH